MKKHSRSTAAAVCILLALCAAPRAFCGPGHDHDHDHAHDHAADSTAAAQPASLPSDGTDLPVDTVIPPLPEPSGSSLWLDLDRDRSRLASVEQVRAIVDTAAMYHFRRIVLDVKTNEGAVAFPSGRAPRAELPLDVCAAFSEAAKKKGIEIVLRFDVLIEGDLRTKKGPAFDNPEWQTVVDVDNRGLMRQSEYAPGGPTIYLNPCLPDVQKYEAAVFEDLLRELKPTTVLLDEIRFYSKAADYSDEARTQFETWIGMGPAPWPESVNNTGNPRYSLWMTYRVGVITEFVRRLVAVRDRVAPDTRVGISVPGYYEPSVDLGMSWIYSGYKPKLWFADGQFRRFSLADVVDEMVVVSRDSNPFVVRDISRGAARGTMNHLPLTVLLNVRPFEGRPARFRECLQQIHASGLSVAIADIDSMSRDGLWEIFREELLAAGTKP